MGQVKTLRGLCVAVLRARDAWQEAGSVKQGPEWEAYEVADRDLSVEIDVNAEEVILAALSREREDGYQIGYSDGYDDGHGEGLTDGMCK